MFIERIDERPAARVQRRMAKSFTPHLSVALLVVGLLGLPLPTLLASTEAQLRDACTASRQNEQFRELVRTLAFEQALKACDANTPAKPKDDCRASARFWLASQRLVEGRFEESVKLFGEGEKLAGEFGRPNGWKQKPGWGATADMLTYATRRRDLGVIRPEFTQKLILAVAQEIDAPYGGKQVRTRLDPCIVLHARLSFGMTARYVETFSAGRMSIAVDHIVLPATVTMLSPRGVIAESSLRPWTADLAATKHKLAAENDAIFYLYPKSGGIANAGGGTVPIVPGIIASPRRAIGRLPTGWATMRNFAQSFHEYLHTAEAMTGFGMTSHGGAATDRLRALTGRSGESEWADWMWQNKIREKADKLAQEKKRSGYEVMFGTSRVRSSLTEQAVREAAELFAKEGSQRIKERRAEALSALARADELRKAGKQSEAAETAYAGLAGFPWSRRNIRRARAIVEKSDLPQQRRQEMLEEIRRREERYYRAR